jgi:hypothetical protein
MNQAGASFPSAPTVVEFPGKTAFRVCDRASVPYKLLLMPEQRYTLLHADGWIFL